MEGYILCKYTKEAWEKGDIQGRQTVVILSFALRSMIDFCSQLTFWTCSPPSSVQPLRVLQKHQNMLSFPHCALKWILRRHFNPSLVIAIVIWHAWKVSMMICKGCVRHTRFLWNGFTKSEFQDVRIFSMKQSFKIRSKRGWCIWWSQMAHISYNALY